LFGLPIEKFIMPKYETLVSSPHGSRTKEATLGHCPNGHISPINLNITAI
jgi:hypothetical protein